MSAPTIVTTFGWTSSQSGTLPAGLQANDLILLYVTPNQTMATRFAASGSGSNPWQALSPVALAAGGGLGGNISYPGVIGTHVCDGTESSTTVTVFVVPSNTYADLAVAGVVVRGSGALTATISDNSGYPWYNSGASSPATDVPAVAAPANCLQLLGSNGQQNGTFSPDFSYTNGWTFDVGFSRWFPVSAWAHFSYSGASAGTATVVTMAGGGVGVPDAYCYVVNVTAKPGGWHIGGIRIH